MEELRNVWKDLSPLIGKTKAFVNEMHEPRRADKQKLDILEEGGLFTFNFMSIKLDCPRYEKNKK